MKHIVRWIEEANNRGGAVGSAVGHQPFPISSSRATAAEPSEPTAQPEGVSWRVASAVLLSAVLLGASAGCSACCICCGKCVETAGAAALVLTAGSPVSDEPRNEHHHQDRAEKREKTNRQQQEQEESAKRAAAAGATKDDEITLPILQTELP